jgi:hypothetical protein
LGGGDHWGAGGRAAQQAPECFALGKGGGDGGFADVLRAAIQNGGQQRAEQRGGLGGGLGDVYVGFPRRDVPVWVAA